MMKSTRVFIVLFLLSLLMVGVVYGFHGSSSLPASGQYNKTVILTTGINSIDSKFVIVCSSWRLIVIDYDCAF